MSELPLPSHAVQFSRSYAAASPYLSKTARMHINGLCDVIEAMIERARRQDRDPTVQYELRIAGPDDVIVFTDEVEALYRANDVNIQYLADRLQNPDNEVMCIATVHRVAAPEVPHG